MLYISELCEDCAVANEIDDAWTNIPGIHDNGPRDHGVWRLTLTVYWEKCVCQKFRGKGIFKFKGEASPSIYADRVNGEWF